MGKLKQYGIVVFGLLLGLGFGGSMFAQNYSGQSAQPTNDQNTRNYTAPNQNFKIGSFDKSIAEQAVISAREDRVFINAFYSSAEERSELENLQGIQQNFGDRAYIQIVNSSSGSDIITQNGIVDFPKVVVISGVQTRRGLSPRQVMVPGAEYSNITNENVEKAICNTLNNLGDKAARCQAIGAF